METFINTSNLSSTSGSDKFQNLSRNGSLNYAVDESNPYRYLYLVLGSLSIAAVPVVVVGNFMVVYSLRRFRRRFSAITNIYIGCLALADMCLGLTTLPLYTIGYFWDNLYDKNKYLCIFKYASVMFSMSSSIYYLTAIAVDRYIAILHPLKYYVKMTPQWARVTVVVIWIYNLLVMFILPFVWHDDSILSQKCDYFSGLPLVHTVFFTFGSIFILLSVCLFLYIRVFRVAIRQRKKNITRKAGDDDILRKQLEKDTKSASMMGLIMFLFFAFWLPFLCCGPLRYTSLDRNLTDAIKSVALFIAQCNSGINPFVYCWIRDDFAWAFKTILKSCFCNDGDKGNTTEIYQSRERSATLEMRLSNNSGAIVNPIAVSMILTHNDIKQGRLATRSHPLRSQRKEIDGVMESSIVSSNTIPDTSYF